MRVAFEKTIANDIDGRSKPSLQGKSVGEFVAKCFSALEKNFVPRCAFYTHRNKILANR
jgi:hypothetical protein